MKSKRTVEPRNHVALALLNRGGASKRHCKPEKAMRAQTKAADRKGIWL